MARGWLRQCRENIKGVVVTWVAVASVGVGATAYGAPPTQTVASSPERMAGNSGTGNAPVVDTNSPVSQIAGDLQRLKHRIETAVDAMTNAVASTPALQAAKVSKLADEITELGTKDLGEQGQIVKQADALIAKFNESVAMARKSSSDPNVTPSARAIYGEVGPRIEGELAKLIDAKSTVARIRTELLRQAEGLRQSADAIGFAEHCNQLVLASEAFRNTLTEVTKFTEKISMLIQSVGKGGFLPLT